MFKIDVCKVCGVNCFWIEGIDGDLAEKEVCSPVCLAQLAVCPTPRALDECACGNPKSPESPCCAECIQDKKEALASNA